VAEFNKEIYHGDTEARRKENSLKAMRIRSRTVSLNSFVTTKSTNYTKVKRQDEHNLQDEFS